MFKFWQFAKLKICPSRFKILPKTKYDLEKWPKGLEGGCPGLVVMGGDSFSEGCGFKFRHCTQDGHFSHIFVVKIVMFV